MRVRQTDSDGFRIVYGVDLETTGGPEGETLIDWLTEDGRNEITRANEQDDGERRGSSRRKKKRKRQKCKRDNPTQCVCVLCKLP